MIYKFEKLFDKVQKDKAVFLGTGQSILEINRKTYDRMLRYYDIWAVNNFIYHDFIVPQFYYVELKKYDGPIFKERLKEKRDQYKDVSFITNSDYVINMIGGGFDIYKFEIIPRKYGNARRHKDKEFNVNSLYVMDKNKITKSYDFSLSAILEILFKAGYKEIILMGHEWHAGCRYFWHDGSDRWGKTHHKWNKEHQDRDPNDPHITWNRGPQYIIDFNERWMLPLDRQIFVGTTNTDLYPDLEHKNI